MTVIGTGTPSFTFAPVTGTVRHFGSPADVIESIESDLESTIALVSSGGTTFLSPILGRLGGIVCLDGTLRSHLAIVSREFEVPCLVGADLKQDLPDGVSIVLDIDGGAGLIRLSDDAEPSAAAPVSHGAVRRGPVSHGAVRRGPVGHGVSGLVGCAGRLVGLQPPGRRRDRGQGLRPHGVPGRAGGADRAGTHR